MEPLLDHLNVSRLLFPLGEYGMLGQVPLQIHDAYPLSYMFNTDEFIKYYNDYLGNPLVIADNTNFLTVSPVYIVGGDYYAVTLAKTNNPIPFREEVHIEEILTYEQVGRLQEVWSLIADQNF